MLVITANKRICVCIESLFVGKNTIISYNLSCFYCKETIVDIVEAVYSSMRAGIHISHYYCKETDAINKYVM